MKVNFNILKNLDSKPNISNIKFKIDKNSAIYKKIKPEIPNIETLIKKENTPLTFFPKSDALTLMNYGPYTTALKNEDLQANIAIQVYDHIYKVNNLTKHTR